MGGRTACSDPETIPIRLAPFPRRHRTLPGLPLTLGVTLAWLSIVVLIPLVALFAKSMGLGPQHFIEVGFSRRALAAYRLSFGAALIAAAISAAPKLSR